MKTERVLELCQISKYEYYKKLGKQKKPGRKPTTTTPLVNERGVIQEASESVVIDKIINTLLLPETAYGYRAMTYSLQHEGFIINHKKVYRLMDKYQLLGDRHQKAARSYVKYRRVSPKRPLEVLEMDIKFQWVAEHQRYAFILTVIDCFTRKVHFWSVGYSIKQAQVKAAWEYIIVNDLQPAGLLENQLTLELRNDNDTRFAAKSVQKYFEDNHINQVFTHPYTPQENGHIESFHSILGRSLDKKEFATLSDLEKHLNYFYEVYNNVRLHGSIQHLNPNAFLRLWEQKQVIVRPHKKQKHRYEIQLKVPHYMIKQNGEIRQLSDETIEMIGRRTCTLNT